jgi:hypothetical protein
MMRGARKERKKETVRKQEVKWKRDQGVRESVLL